MKKTSIILSVLFVQIMAFAQVRIDINNIGRQVSEGLESNYQAWTFGRVNSASGTFLLSAPDSIHVTISSVPGLQGNGVRTNYWKQGVVNFGYKLLADGCTVVNLTGNGNECNEITTGSSGIQLIVEGLPAGDHTLLAYHNAMDNYVGKNIASVDVMVDGATVSTGNKQTSRVAKNSESGYSYIHFSCKEESPVVIQYISKPVDEEFYSFTGVVINALVFDEPNPITTASDPSPKNQDLHVDADNGEARVSWKAAGNAVKHHLMVGTSEDDLQELAVLQDTTYILKDLYSLNTYYWRIDEEDAEGVITKSDKWMFRPRHLAFPGAEGYGRFASGGRGGDVYHVTSLEDNNMPGTLRYGIESGNGPRTIVFDVGGVITLQSRLVISKPFITIAGQTAPGNGIMMRSRPFGMSNEGITRFVRMRLGGGDSWNGEGPNPNTADGMGMTGNDHSIMDHCSISWTIDEAFSSRNAKNMTLQRTLISEALNYAGHATQYEQQGKPVQHGYAATIGGQAGSYHHNLLAHNQGRNWSMGGGLDGGGFLAGRLDMFNNVCYNWYKRTTDGGSHEMQFVNNYYKMGPDTQLTTLFSLDHEGVGIGTQIAYVNGNIRENKDGTLSVDKLGDTYRTTGTVDYESFANKCFFPSYATIHTAKEAFKIVLSDVGCSQPELDNHDIRMIDETLNGKTSTIGYWTKLKGIIDRESDAEGFAGLNIITENRPDGYDTDQDGMPDWWEKMTGTDANALDNNMDTDKDGYTCLEEYLNWLAEAHYIIKSDETVKIQLKDLFRGFVNQPSYTISSVEGHINAAINEEKTLVVSGLQNGLGIVDVTVVDEDENRMMRRVNIGVTDVTPSSVLSISSNNIHKYQFYTTDGMKIEEGHIGKGNKIDLSKFKHGVYVIKTIDVNGMVNTTKITNK